MTNITINYNCNASKSYPFSILGGIVLIFCLFLPLLLFKCNWNSRYPRGRGDLKVGGLYFYIPSISKTWRNYNSIYPVFTGALIVIVYYSVCLWDRIILMCILFGIALALLVFLLNDETGPISYVHIIFAFTFFIYLLWLVYAVRIYFPENYIWYWPYFPMGVCIGLILYNCYLDYSYDSDNKQEHWPWWTSTAEYLYVVSFLINIILIP